MKRYFLFALIFSLLMLFLGWFSYPFFAGLVSPTGVAIVYSDMSGYFVDKLLFAVSFAFLGLVFGWVVAYVLKNYAGTKQLFVLCTVSVATLLSVALWSLALKGRAKLVFDRIESLPDYLSRHAVLGAEDLNIFQIPLFSGCLVLLVAIVLGALHTFKRSKALQKMQTGD